MANVKLVKPDGQTFEISDISFDQLKELVGVNGHANGVAPRPSIPKSNFENPDISAFRKKLSDNAKKFFKFLSESPNGISADILAEKLGYTNTLQIGGLMGGGITKIATKYGLKMSNYYSKEVRRVDGTRTVIYKPGKFVIDLLL